MADTKPVEREDETWITVGGKKVKIKPGEEGEDAIREALPSVRGEKESNSKQALHKEYIQPRDISKTLFHIRDEVVFDKYNKSGIVAGLDGNYVKILYNKNIEYINKDSVFKKSELLSGQHWDTSNLEDRTYFLNKAGYPAFYANRTWTSFSNDMRDRMIKTNSPAGYESTTAGVGNPIYNPLNDDKTVSQRIKEEEAKQREDNQTESKD